MSNITQVLLNTTLNATNYSSPISSSSSNEEPTSAYIATGVTLLAGVIALGLLCRQCLSSPKSLWGRVFYSREQNLLSACQNLDKDCFEQILKKDLAQNIQRINSSIFIGNLETTYLIEACKHIDCSTVEKEQKSALFITYLIALGAGVNTADALGFYPIHYAARSGSELIVKKLLENGVNANQSAIKDQSGLNEQHDTPFSEAVKYGQVKVAELLFYKIKSPLPVVSMDEAKKLGNVKTPSLTITRINGDTFTHLAFAEKAKVAENKILDMLRFLLDEARMDISAKNHFAETVLHYAAKYKLSQVMSYLLNKIKYDGKKSELINVQNYDQETALFIAAQNGDLSIVKALVNAGADIKLANSKKITPEVAAARKGHTEVVKFLQDKALNTSKQET